MKDLVKRAMHKDAKAFVDLMQYHMQSMYKVARSFLRNDDDIADAIQETILTCFEKLDTLKEPKYFKTWMTRILINHCKDILKNNFRQFPQEDFTNSQAFWMPMENLEFYELLDTLDEKYKTILILYYVEGFKVAEIAQLLDLKQSTVKMRLVRGRKSLAAEYQPLMTPLKGEGKA